jgi:lysine 6-dehydrogenase
LKEGEEDYTIMRITIEGIENKEKRIYQYNLLDRYDKGTNTISMARTTGYTCTAVANLLLEKKYTQNGIIPPEYLGEDVENYQFILDYLKYRKVIYKRSEIL